MKTSTKTLFSIQIEANPKAHELSIALAMAGLNTNIQSCELILEAQKAMAEMGGNFDLRTGSKIQVEIDKKYAAMEDEFKAQTKPK